MGVLALLTKKEEPSPPSLPVSSRFICRAMAAADVYACGELFAAITGSRLGGREGHLRARLCSSSSSSSSASSPFVVCVDPNNLIVGYSTAELAAGGCVHVAKSTEVSLAMILHLSVPSPSSSTLTTTQSILVPFDRHPRLLSSLLGRGWRVTKTMLDVQYPISSLSPQILQHSYQKYFVEDAIILRGYCL